LHTRIEGLQAARRGNRYRADHFCVLALTISWPCTAALAGPTGGQITAGSGTISQSGNTTTVTQNSANLDLSWLNFNIAANQTVNFVQPGAGSIAINRILGNSASTIFGHLDANGQVWLINPNGILFGKGAQVDVGGLVASALGFDANGGLTTSTFSGNGTGHVVNQGNITATDGGYVALLGNQVSNQGVISAHLGTVALGAGSAETLTFNGEQLLHLKVDQSTLDNLAQNKQLIEADGGRVIMTAGAQDALLASVVNNTGVIEARGVENHNGTITLLAGMQAGTTEVAGTLDASAASTGNGGSIETSGAHVTVSDTAKILAPGGTWLIDPTDLTIDATAATTIDNSLNAGTSVVEQTTATSASGVGTQSAGAGNINVNAPITWTNAAATLTLSAFNAINVNSPINGAGAVVMQATNGNLTLASGATITGAAGVTLGTGANFVNNAGASAISSGTARWLVYSTNPTLDTDGGLTPDFIQYAAPFETTPAQGTGNGFLYSVAPSITVGALTGSVTKTYDGTTTAALTSSNFTASGLLNGDTVTAMAGTYESADVGSNLTVTAPASAAGLTVTNAGGTIPVYGYALSGSAPSAAIGSITPAQLGAAIVGNPTKVYDGTTTATLSSGNYALSGFVAGQGATVNQPSSVAYAGASAGAETVNATFSATNFLADSGTKLSNYTLPTSASGQGTVTPAPLVVTGVLANNKVYDTTTSDTLNTVNAGLFGVIGTDSVGLVTSGATGTFASSNVGNNLSVTAAGFTLSGAQQADYQLVQPPGLTANITPATVTLSGVAATGKVYNGNTADVLNSSGATLSGLLGADASTVSLSTAAGSGTFATQNVGTNIAVAASGFALTGTNASNYVLTEPTGLTANITPAPLTVALIGNPSKPYNGTTTAALFTDNFSITGFVPGEGASIPQITSGTYASANAGTQTVTAALNASDFLTTGSTLLSNYSIPTSVSGTGTITPAPLAVSLVGNPTKVFDNTTTATLSSANYVLTGFVGTQSATVNQTSGVYASANAGLEGVSASLSSSNYVAGSGTLLSNYSLPVTASGTGTITPLPVTGSIQAGITGNPTKTYDGTTVATLNSANYVLSGFIDGQGATVAQPVGAYASPNAGPQTVTASLTGSDFTANSGTILSNYTLPSTAFGTGTINPAPLSVSIVGDPTRVYNGSTNMVLASSSYQITGFVTGQGASINPAALINYANPNVGTQTLTAALTPSAYTANSSTLLTNYVLPSSATGTGNITPAPLFVTGVIATNKVYDTNTTDPLMTTAQGLAGLVPSDAGNVTLLGTATGTFASSQVGTGIPVTVSGLSLGGSAATNYSLQALSNISANITPAPLSITGVGANSKPYDGTTTASLNSTAAALNGVLGNDTVTVLAGGATATFGSSNVGNNLGVTVGGFTIGGPQAGDYTVSQPAGLTANITPAPITAVIIGNPTKVYDGSSSTTLTAANYTLQGFAPGQGAAVPQSATASYSAPDAGTNIPITSTLVLSDFVANSGTNLANYAMPPTGAGTGTITQAPLTATIVGTPTKQYDGTIAATLSSGNYQLAGFVVGQSATVNQTTGTYAEVNAGSESVTAALSGSNYVAASGTNLNNYALPASATGSGLITPAPLTVVTVNTTSRVYNGSTIDALSGATLSGTVFNGDTPTLTNTGSGTLSNSGDVGTDTVTTAMGLTGAGSGNYALVQPSGLTAVISAATLTASSSVTKTYDGTTTASLSGANTVLSGFVAGQGATVNAGVTGTFSGANVGTGVTVTGGALTTSQLTANAGTVLSNYILPSSDNGTGTINPATLTYTAVPSSQQYGITPTGLTGSISGFVDGQTLASATTGSAAFTTAATAASNVGKYAIDGSGLTADNGNYIFAQAAANATALTITPAPLTVVTVNTTSRVYNGSTIDALSGATLSGTVFNGDTPTLTNTGSGTLSNSGDVGTDTVTTAMGLTGTGSGNYALVQPSGLTAVISAATLTASSSVTKTYDGTTTASLSGANTVLSGFVAGQGATVNAGVTGTFSGADVGTGVTVTGGALTTSQLTANSGTVLSNYILPSSDNGTGTINPAVVNLTGSRVYNGGTDAAAGIFGSAGTVNGVDGQTLTLTGIGTLASKDTGTPSLSSLGSLALNNGTGAASNYTLVGGTDSVSVSPLAITVTATGNGKVYDGTLTDSVSLASNGVFAGDTVTFSDTSAQFADPNVGTAKPVTVSGISLGGTNANDYTVSDAMTTTTAAISPAIVSFTGTRVYDGGTDANASVFGSNGTVAGIAGQTLVLSGSGTLVGKNVGSEGVTSLGTLALGNGTGLASNYTLVGGTDTVSVTPLAITVIGAGTNKVYDGTVLDTVSLTSNGLIAGDDVTFSDTSAVFGDKNVGMGKTVAISGIADSGTDAGNYTLNNSTASTTANITPLAIAVTGTGTGKVYDGTVLDSVTLASSGILAGDSVTFSDTSAVFGDKNAGMGKTVTISGIAAGGTDGADYTVNSVATTTANITPLAITVTGTGISKVYDGTVLDTVTLASSGILAGDSVTFSDTSSVFGDKNVGTGKAVTISGITAGGADGEDYAVNSVATTAANITPLAITVGASGTNKVYDGAVLDTVSLASSGLIAGDHVTFSDTSAVFGDKNVGNGKAVTISGIADSGTDAGNYTLNNSTASTTANITPLAITVTGTGTNKVYDGTVLDAVTLASGGVLAGDNVTFSDASAVFDNKNVGTGKTVTISGITAGGANGEDYAVNSVATTAANITPLAITVSASGTNKVYDGTVLDAVSFASSGILAGDSVTFSDTSAVFNSKNVGNGKTVTVTGITAGGADAGNYTLTNMSATTSANITPATLTETATPDKIFIGNSPTLTGTVTGLVGGDTLNDATSGTLSWATNAPNHPAWGSFAIDGSGLTAANYVIVQAPTNFDALSIAPGLVGPAAAAESVVGDITYALGAARVATPYGIGSSTYNGASTGNLRRDPDPTDSNRHLTDFTGQLPLKVLDGGVRMPAEILQ
jgi:trimeric autotransporter adhesin